MKTTSLTFAALLLFSLLPIVTQAAPPPALMLANVYHDDIVLAEYWVSEKLDGVRAYWDGQRLISRGGHVIQSPTWFTANFPEQPLDGELWQGRGQFDALSGAVRKEIPDAQEWRKIRYHVFDMPNASGDFTQRLQTMQALFARLSSPYIALVHQRKYASQQSLMKALDDVIAQGGEGLMLHRGSANYRGQRSDDLLKLKRYQDAEAVVIAHLPGKGKYQGAMGALLVEMPDGNRFKIGSGFSDAQRRDPPPIGSQITYKYYGLTSKGIPRFASFVRERPPL